MSTSTTADNTVLTLYPPKVQGQTNGIIGAMAGVPKVAIDLVSDGEGAMVLIDPPLVGTWARLDVVKLWLVGDATLLYTFTIGDPNVTIVLRIPRGRMHPDRVNGLFYTVERNSSNIGTSEPPLTLLYNFIRPGLRDRQTVPGGHSELKLDLSDLIAKGVDKDFVSAQICVNYPYCRAYDTITLKCNGEIQTFPVSKDQAPQPPNPGTEEPTTICFTITRAFLEEAKRLDNILNFSYTVTDQLLNGPDPDAVWSVVLAVPEDLDGTLLNKAILLERIEDYPEQGSGKIELDKLANNNLLLVVLTRDDRFVVGYTVNATYTAKINGQPDRVIPVSGKVEADPFGAKKTCIIEVLNEHVIDASSVTVTYELLDLNGAMVARSAPTTEPVVGTHLELKPPSVLQANGATLAPMDALTQLTIVVPPGFTRPTDLLSVSWTAKPGTHEDGSITTQPRPISEIGLNIPIDPALMAYCLGEPTTVSYSITRDGIPLPSETLTLNVQNLPQTALIAPRLKEAANAGEGAELNLIDLTPEGKMWCPGFPLIAEGQPVWLLFKGTNANDTPYERYVWEGSFAYVNADWVREGFFESTAPYEDLQGLKDGTPLTIEMSVGFGKSKDKALAKRFVVRSYSVRAVENVPPSLTSVKGSPSGKVIDRDGFTEETAVNVSGAAALSQKVEVFDGVDSKGEVDVDDQGVWEHFFAGLHAGKHTLTVRAKYGAFPDSASYDFEVLRPFTIDTTLMELKGLNINADFLALTGTPAPGSALTRVPISGDGSYSYSSSAPNIASVSANGMVSGLKNGNAVITVRETSTQRDLSFPVKVENVFRLVMTPTHTYSIGAALNWMNSIQGVGVSDAAIAVLRIKFRPLVSSYGGWLCRSDGCGAGQYLSVVTNNPNAWSIACYPGNNVQAHGWCLVSA